MKEKGLTGAELLAVSFIVLKLCGVIDWPWIWVLAPTWISLLIAIVAIIVILWRTR